MWYPEKLTEQEVKRKIMREAFIAGYNVKSIAAYFKLKPCSVYDKVNIRGLKLKIAEKRLAEKN